MTRPDPAWRIETDAAGIVWASFDKPGASTNVLSRDALVELDGYLREYAQNPPRGLVLRSAKSNGFIAGADVKEFVALESESQAVEMVRAAHEILARLESLACPTVAILHGF